MSDPNRNYWETVERQYQEAALERDRYREENERLRAALGHLSEDDRGGTYATEFARKTIGWVDPDPMEDDR